MTQEPLGRGSKKSRRMDRRSQSLLRLLTMERGEDAREMAIRGTTTPSREVDVVVARMAAGTKADRTTIGMAEERKVRAEGVAVMIGEEATRIRQSAGTITKMELTDVVASKAKVEAIGTSTMSIRDQAQAREEAAVNVVVRVEMATSEAEEREVVAGTHRVEAAIEMTTRGRLLTVTMHTLQRTHWMRMQMTMMIVKIIRANQQLVASVVAEEVEEAIIRVDVGVAVGEAVARSSTRTTTNASLQTRRMPFET